MLDTSIARNAHISLWYPLVMAVLGICAATAVTLNLHAIMLALLGCC